MKQKHLKTIRIIVSLIFLLLIGFMFIDFKQLLPQKLIDAALYLQFVPSVLKFIQVFSISALGFLFIILLSLLFGRVYCSSICPLGTLQDVISFIGKKFKKSKRKYKYSRPKNILRYSILGITVISFIAGTILIVNLLDPYSNFGRIFSDFLQPAYIKANNILAGILNKRDIYTLQPQDIIPPNWYTLIYPVIFVIFLFWLSFWHGRLYCNTVCPVGTLLGLLSKYSMLKIKFDKEKCTICGKCSNVCKSSCIQLKGQKVDFSRCVACYNCINTCPEDAIRYQFNWKKNQQPTIQKQENSSNTNSKRDFINKSLLFVAGIVGLSKLINAQHADVEVKEPSTIPEDKKYPISPPGSLSLQHFNHYCTGCHLCVSACPTKVLQVSLFEYGTQGLLQPHMDYHANFCNYECKVCTEVCPTGAIMPQRLDDKKKIQIGVVIFEKENCVVYTENTACGACSEHCPTKAVRMVPYKDGITIPETDQDLCIGCGACEYICPTRPYRAIYVDGNKVHQQAKEPVQEELEQPDTEEKFPF